MRQWMRYAAGILISLTAFPAAGCTAVNFDGKPKIEVTSYEEKIFKLDKQPALSLRGDSAGIEIYTWEKQEIKFEIRKKLRGSGTRDLLKKKLEKIDVDLERKSDVYYCNSNYRGKIEKASDVCTDFRIYLPREPVVLEFKLGQGSIKLVDELKGSLTMKLDTAKVNIGRFDGKLKIASNKGNVTLEGGYLDNGSDIKIGTGHLRLKCACNQPGEYSFETGTGNVEIQMPEESRFNLESVGSIGANEFEPGKYPVKLKLKSSLGLIYLNKYPG